MKMTMMVMINCLYNFTVDQRDLHYLMGWILSAEIIAGVLAYIQPPQALSWSSKRIQNVREYYII